MCKYCDELEQMWKQYKKLDSKYEILCQCNYNNDSDYFVWCDMQNLLRNYAILAVEDYSDEIRNTYYFTDNTSFNPITGQYKKHATSFKYCPMCGRKL